MVAPGPTGIESLRFAPRPGCSLDPLVQQLAPWNVWCEPAARHSEVDLRWVAIVLGAGEVQRTLKELACCPGNIEPHLCEKAAVTLLYADGASATRPLVQAEIIMRAENIAPLLRRLQAAKLLSPRVDEQVLVRGVKIGLESELCVFAAPSGASFAQLVRRRW